MNNIFVSTACLKGDKSYERVLNEFLSNDIKCIELTGVHPYLNNDQLELLLLKYIQKGVSFTFHNYFPPPKKPIVLNYLTQNLKLKKKVSGNYLKCSKFSKKDRG